MSRKMKTSIEDKVFDTVVTVLLILLIIVIAYPLYFIIIASISDPSAVSRGEVLIWPRNFSLEGYNKVFSYSEIWVGYKNTIIYTVLGTLLSVSVTISCGFAFSRKKVKFRNLLLTLFIIPMFFGGGLVPTFLTIQRIGLLNNPVLLIILGSVSTYNILIAKSFISSSIPEELYEAAHIDGCGDLRYLVTVLVPLSKALIAVQVIFAASGYWNSYFNALIYITKPEYKPLSLVIRKILIDTDWSMADSMDIGRVGSDATRAQLMMLAVKYCVFIVSSLPLMFVYPFARKHFVKGVMIGSVKG